MRKLFGTDGIRGLAGEYPLQPLTVFAVGRSLVDSGYRRIVIGRDTRISGPWIERNLALGIETGGGVAVAVGIITTPGIAYLCRGQGFDAGVVISASHNPFQDNGIKIFGASGLKLSDAEEARLERRIEAYLCDNHPEKHPAGPTDIMSGRDSDRIEHYVQFLTGTSNATSLAGAKVALDCANGASFAIAHEVFERLGAEVVAIADNPDGTNINLDCGALHPQLLADFVRRRQADVGFAFDGDADRLILVDERGTVRDGDFVLYVLGRELASKGRLPSRTIVSTVMANLGLEVALRRDGIALQRTRVGDRYVLAAMLEGSHELGGEQSGHTIIRSQSVAGDGILTAVQILNVMHSRQTTVSELCRGFEKFPQVLRNVRVRDKLDFEKIPSIQGAIQAARSRLGDDGRVLIRYSGTEPLARVMLEGPQQDVIEALSSTIANHFRAELGAPD